MHTGRDFMVRFWANVKSLFNTHTTNKNNPHGVTKSQIGLANVENKSSATIRREMTSDNVTDALGYTPLDAAKKGAASGVAELDATGKVPSAQLPSYVDDTIEGYLSGGKFYKESSHTTQITGEAGKIYVELSTNKTYRWSGSTYVEISQSLALGETSTTAYRGDRGKAAYDHISNKSNPHAVTKEQVGLGNVPNVATNDQTPTFTAVDKDTALVSGEKLSSILGKIARTILTVISLKNTVDELNSNLTDVEESVAGLNGNYAEYNYGGGVCQNEGQVTGNTITISESGTYLIWASAKNTGTSSTGFTELSIVINGTLCPLDIVSHEGVNLICTGIYMGNFQDGDQLYHRVFQNGGFPETINERYLRIIKLK